MCLVSTDTKTRKNWRVGYKLVFAYPSELRGIVTDFIYPVGRWITDPKKETSHCGEPIGFYLYRNLKEAQVSGWQFDAIYKCMVKDIIATGQNHGQVLVAKKIMLVREVWSRK